MAGRVHLEIAGQIARVAGVVPEAQGHGRDGLGADQFAHLAEHRLAGVVPGFDGRAEHAALHDAGALRQLAVAGDEATGKVGAARNIEPPDIALRLCFGNGAELLGAPLLHFGRQRRAGAAQGAHARQVAALGQIDAGLGAAGKKRRARAQKGDAVARRKAPQHTPVGRVARAARAAVVDHAGGARQQAGHLAVPHHPAGGAVPVKALAEVVGAVAAADVHVQVGGDGHQQDAAVRVHDGLEIGRAHV